MTGTTGAVRPLNGHRPDPVAVPVPDTDPVAVPVPDTDPVNPWEADWTYDIPVPDIPADAVPDIDADTVPIMEPGSAGTAGSEDVYRSQVRLVPVSSVQMRPVYWTWQDRIPSGSLTLIPGREGIGKSLMLAWLSAQITRGTLPGQWLGRPRSVIYAATEDSWSQTIAPRLYAAGADLDRVYLTEVTVAGTGSLLSLPRDCDALGAEIERYDVALLAADPLMSLIAGTIDTHNDHKLRVALEPLSAMADRTGCAVVGLAHFNKSGSVDVSDLITGSRGFSAVSRAVMAVARDTVADDGSCVLSQTKHNLGSLDLPSLRYMVETAEVLTEEGPAHVGRLVFTGEADRSVADILRAAAATPERSPAGNQAAEWLRAFLTDQGGSAGRDDVVAAAEAAGFKLRTLQRNTDKAGVTISREGFPSVTVWRLNDGDAPSPDSGAAAHSRHSHATPQHGATGATGESVARLDGSNLDTTHSQSSLWPTDGPSSAGAAQ